MKSIHHVAVITGSRKPDVHKERVLRRMRELYRVFGRDGLLIIHGDATGVDAIADQACVRSGVRCVKVPALFAANGKLDGPLRNLFMLNLAESVRMWLAPLGLRATISVEAFPGPDSRGTWNCVKQARSAEIAVNIFEE